MLAARLQAKEQACCEPLGISAAREDEVGEAALLVGDRARIDRIADHLEAPQFPTENRGLRTVTGMRAGKRVTADSLRHGRPDRRHRAA